MDIQLIMPTTSLLHADCNTTYNFVVTMLNAVRVTAYHYILDFKISAYFIVVRRKSS